MKIRGAGMIVKLTFTDGIEIVHETVDNLFVNAKEDYVDVDNGDDEVHSYEFKDIKTIELAKTTEEQDGQTHPTNV